MAFNMNLPRGVPAQHQRNTNPSGNTPGSARPQGRMRPRDVQRMAQYNERQHNERFGNSNWANQVDNAQAYEEAQARPSRPPPRANNRPRRPPPTAPTTVVETPPKDEQLYIGNGRGSKPVKKTLGQNFDCAGFIPLVRQVYDRICVEDQRIPRSLPFAMFQHAMTEHLNAYLLHHAKYVLKVPELQSAMDPLSAISAEDYNIPQPIFEYICGFAPVITPTGDKVYWNLPSLAVPKETHVENSVAVRSGSFGPATTDTHNVYES